MSESNDIFAETLNPDELITDSELGSSNILTENSDLLDNKKDSPTINKPVKYVRLPFSKIKQIMKMDPDCALVQQDAAFLVTKATEMFIEFLTKETYKQLMGNKRKTLTKRDVDATIEVIPQLCFLDGALE